MNGFNPMSNMSMGMPGQGGFNPMANMSMGVPPRPQGKQDDFMKLMMLMMLMQPGQGHNPYLKRQTPRILGELLGKLGPLFLKKFL